MAVHICNLKDQPEDTKMTLSPTSINMASQSSPASIPMNLFSMDNLLQWYHPLHPSNYGYDTRVPGPQGAPVRPLWCMTMADGTEPVLLAKATSDGPIFTEPLYL